MSYPQRVCQKRFAFYFFFLRLFREFSGDSFCSTGRIERLKWPLHRFHGSTGSIRHSINIYVAAFDSLIRGFYDTAENDPFRTLESSRQNSRSEKNDKSDVESLHDFPHSSGLISVCGCSWQSSCRHVLFCICMNFPALTSSFCTATIGISFLIQSLWVKLLSPFRRFLKRL